jgi:hypothetical protein
MSQPDDGVTQRHTPHLYGFPDMGRTGLAHSLLAWGRCAVWCRDTGATMMAPRWLRLRVGPYLRRERDKRNYFLTFRPGPLLWEPQRSLIRLRAQTLYAELDLPDPGFAPSRPTVVIFRNAQALSERKMFHYIVKDGAYLRDRLVSITRPQFVPAPATAPFIAVHVRLGDFSKVSEAAIRSGATNARLSVDWYGHALDQLRASLGRDFPAVVFSDGSDEELAPLLSRPGVQRSPKSPAITDLLAISQATAMVASGSGFSHWGSFLGGVPRVCYIGQGLKHHVPMIEAEVESDGTGELPEGFVKDVKQRISLLSLSGSRP